MPTPRRNRPDPKHPRPFHHKAIFGLGERVPLSRDQRRIWLARAELVRHRTRWLTPLHVKIGEALERRLGADGQCDPSHATLAADVGCDESAVGDALKALKGLGLLTWDQRLVRRPWPERGPGATRAEQTSNQYQLRLPTGPVGPRKERRRRRPAPARKLVPPSWHVPGHPLPVLVEAPSSKPAFTEARQEMKSPAGFSLNLPAGERSYIPPQAIRPAHIEPRRIGPDVPQTASQERILRDWEARGARRAARLAPGGHRRT